MPFEKGNKLYANKENRKTKKELTAEKNKSRDNMLTGKTGGKPKKIEPTYKDKKLDRSGDLAKAAKHTKEKPIFYCSDELWINAVWDTFFDFLKKGNFETTACMAVGIQWNTYERWLMRGQQDDTLQVDSIYMQFFREVCLTLAYSEMEIVENFRGFTKTDSSACIQFLSRRYKDKWENSNKSNIQLTANVDSKKEVILNIDEIVKTEKQRELVEDLLCTLEPSFFGAIEE